MLLGAADAGASSLTQSLPHLSLRPFVSHQSSHEKTEVCLVSTKGSETSFYLPHPLWPCSSPQSIPEECLSVWSINVRSYSRSQGLAEKAKPGNVRTNIDLLMVLEALSPGQVLAGDGGHLIACQETALPQDKSWSLARGAMRGAPGRRRRGTGGVS